MRRVAACLESDGLSHDLRESDCDNTSTLFVERSAQCMLDMAFVLDLQESIRMLSAANFKK